MINKHLFFTLGNLLRRNNLDENTPPNVFEWQGFIEKINNIFYDLEQERYLLERSMEISSREMLELNDRLEFSQEIARIGYWVHDLNEDKVLWSKEIYRLLGIDPNEAVPVFEHLIDFIHEEDRPILVKMVDLAFSEGKSYEIELRLKNQSTQQFVWAYVKAHPTKIKNQTKENVKSQYLLSGICMDIDERKKKEAELAKLNREMVVIAKKAGMSEIATSVLHNIGNTLNSVNTSLSLLQEIIENSNVHSLVKLSDLINDNLPKKADYLVSDDKGK